MVCELKVCTTKKVENLCILLIFFDYRPMVTDLVGTNLPDKVDGKTLQNFHLIGQ